MPEGDLVAALRREGVADVDDSSLARALYSSDASLYRVVPRLVVRPRDVDELLATLAVARECGTPLTMRGAGTSIAGNAVGPGVVVDTSKHLNQVLDLDPQARTARVEPGTVHATLQRAAGAQGLRFGPDPSTHTRCTVGGMVGNNACGSRALGYGRTVDNVVGLDVVTGTGERLSLGAGRPESDLLDRLEQTVDRHLSTIRTEFGRFGRQVSGYSLEHLLPENGRSVERFLVGSEGTLAVVLGATVRLVEDAPYRALAVLGYPSMAEAADAVPGLLAHPLVACEGLDSRIVDVVRARVGAVPGLPRGGGWLFCEVTGSTEAEARAAAAAVATDADALDHRLVTGTPEMLALWRIREDGAGLAARSLARPAHAGWEDAAVPPARLGEYLRAFEELLREHRLDGVPYGHFGDGCVHIRIDFPLGRRGPGDPDGTVGFRSFVEAAATMTASYGGSLSGEHGDGRARSALLPRMYSADAIGIFGAVKAVFDPDNLLNPGVLVAPRPFDADIRLTAPMREPRTTLRLVHDGGSVVDAVHRCTGVGKCLADNTGSAGVMCPSYLATRDEKDSTRGRARVLQEMLNGGLVTDGWRSDEVHEALDLCLSCKGCASDCPTGIDMATYKAEALHQKYRRRLRPRSHYALGQLPRWARLAQPIAPMANRLMRLGVVQRAARAAAGIDQRRSIPTFAPISFRRWAAGRPAPARPDVVVWADSFTDSFATSPGRAAVALLESAGLSVGVVGEPACCGLTWFSTGQLDAARRIVAGTVETLHRYVDQGTAVVGLEPSCLAALRSDALELLDDPRALDVAKGVSSLAEYLSTLPGWEPPDLTGTEIVVQPHCHQASVVGWAADAALLARTGAKVTRLGGCCGLAGNFGVEKGHYEVSVAVAEQSLLPAVRQAGEGVVVLADGFSCRTQLADLAGVPALHLAELLGGAR